MHYKGYFARIEYSDEDVCFVGHISGIHDIVGFHGESVVGLRVAFEEAVDDYLDACKNVGREPQKSDSGESLSKIKGGGRFPISQDRLTRII